MKNATAKIPLNETLSLFLENELGHLAWATRGGYATVIKIFFNWVEKNKLALGDVDPKKMNQFTKYLAQTKPCIETRWKVRCVLYQYLMWLYKNDYQIHDPDALIPYKKPRADLLKISLPKDAKDFIELSKTTLKPSTVSTYSTSLKHFHAFLNKEKINVKNITRRETEEFFKFLLSKNQKSSTRLGTTVVVRKYLQWLGEHKKIKVDPDILVRARDLPKVPIYLPRPIPPEMDQLIQKRLSESTDLSHKGLLLMRWTGIRVGELSNLSRDCIKTDFNGSALLKVPLGKLNNERLVPVSTKILKLIDAIKKQVDETVNAKEVHNLLASPLGKPIATHNLMFAFKEVTGDIKSPEPLVTHRLRHTYATELLNGGINIFALRDILGHRDIRMTLRYAEVTQEKVRAEYFGALDRLETEQKYQQQILSTIDPEESDHAIILRNLSLEIKRKVRSQKLPYQTYTQLNKRIQRLRKDIEIILK